MEPVHQPPQNTPESAQAATQPIIDVHMPSDPAALQSAPVQSEPAAVVGDSHAEKRIEAKSQPKIEAVPDEKHAPKPHPDHSLTAAVMIAIVVASAMAAFAVVIYLNSNK